MANKNTVRKLPMKAIEKANEMYNETVSVDFHEDDGNTYTVTIHPFFDPHKIQELINSLHEDLQQIEKAKIVLPDKLLPTYILFKCVETFTDFPISKSNSIKRRFSYFIEVTKTHYFKEVTDMFLPSEFQKVWGQILELMATHERIKELGMRAQAEIQGFDFKSQTLRKRMKGVDIE